MIIAVSLLLISNQVFAGNADCGEVLITKLFVQADRQDNSSHANKLLLGFESSGCSSVVYLENTDDAYPGILSMALTAYTTQQRIRVVADDNPELLAAGAMRIQWLNFQ